MPSVSVSQGVSHYLSERHTKNVSSKTDDKKSDFKNAVNPDFLALGLGGTNLLAMLWAVAMGRRAVGVEMRGDPFLVEYIDDRWKDVVPHRTITIGSPVETPDHPDPAKIRSDMQEVLDGPSTFQASAFCIQKMLLRYLDKMEKLDMSDGYVPRVRLFTCHRVVETKGQGFVEQSDGKMVIVLEEVSEIDMKGKTVRVTTPGSKRIHIGTPELFCVAQGFHSSDAERLGFEQKDVTVDHNDGRGPVVAQADYVAGMIECLVGGRLRRRIASEFDKDGNEYWVRQIAVGHERDPEVGWILVQVPDYKTFCPIEAGLLPAGTCKKSTEYFAAYQILIYDFYIEQAALVLDMDVEELKEAQMVYGPKMFTLVERVGGRARLARNGVVAGDSFGNGHFLTSAGAMTGMLGHAYRFLEYWQRRDEGHCAESSISLLSKRIKDDTTAWLGVSAKEFSEAIPINFGAERGAQFAAASGIDLNRRTRAVDAGRRERHGLLPLDPGDWRRFFVRNGRVLTNDLPPLNPTHPALRDQDHLLPQEVKKCSGSCGMPIIRARL